MGVLPVTKEQSGKKTLRKCPLTHCSLPTSTVYGSEFVGHYQDVCENRASTTLWLDVGRAVDWI
ncbi:cellulose biosynthesis cyclic di-GMP-binding regulatory protein BcsB [Shigella flexneri]